MATALSSKSATSEYRPRVSDRRRAWPLAFGTRESCWSLRPVPRRPCPICLPKLFGSLSVQSLNDLVRAFRKFERPAAQCLSGSFEGLILNCLTFAKCAPAGSGIQKWKLPPSNSTAWDHLGMRTGLMPAVAVITISALSLIGCSSDADPSISASTSTASVVTKPPTSAPSVPPVAVKTSITSVVAPDIPGKIVVREDASSCVNPSPASPVSLVSTSTEVGVAGYAGNAVRVTWTYSGDLPAAGTVLFSLTGANQAGTVVKQLGYKTLDGQQIAYFVFDSSSKQLNLAGFPDTSVPGEISAVMPSAAVDALGQNWHWSSSLNVNGHDVDICPN